MADAEETSSRTLRSTAREGQHISYEETPDEQLVVDERMSEADDTENGTGEERNVTSDAGFELAADPAIEIAARERRVADLQAKIEQKRIAERIAQLDQEELALIAQLSAMETPPPPPPPPSSVRPNRARLGISSDIDAVPDVAPRQHASKFAGFVEPTGANPVLHRKPSPWPISAMSRV